MKYTLYIFSFIFALIISSCDDSPKKKESVRENFRFRKVSIADSSSSVPEGVSIHLSWPEMESGSPSKEMINMRVREKFLESFVQESPELIGDPTENSLRTMATTYVKESVASIQEFGETGGWFLDIHVDTSYIGRDIISYIITNDTYSGGAHGYHGEGYFYLSLKDAKPIEAISLFADTTNLSSMLERNFRKEKQLSDRQPLTDGGLFEDMTGHFPISKNISIRKDGAAFVYNAYEIAAFSEGTLEVFIPDSELIPLLKDKKKP